MSMDNTVITNHTELLKALGEEGVRESQKYAVRGLIVLCCGYRAAMYKLFDGGVSLGENVPEPMNTKKQVDVDVQRALSAVLTLAEDLFGSDADTIVTLMTEELNPVLKSCGVEIVKDAPAASINPDGSVVTKARLDEEDLQNLLENFEPDTEGN